MSQVIVKNPTLPLAATRPRTKKTSAPKFVGPLIGNSSRQSPNETNNMIIGYSTGWSCFQTSWKVIRFYGLLWDSACFTVNAWSLHHSYKELHIDCQKACLFWSMRNVAEHQFLPSSITAVISHFNTSWAFSIYSQWPGFLGMFWQTLPSLTHLRLSWSLKRTHLKSHFGGPHHRRETTRSPSIIGKLRVCSIDLGHNFQFHPLKLSQKCILNHFFVPSKWIRMVSHN